jgi:hypothetical protein
MSMLKRALLMAMVAICATVAVANAATPQPGGVYRGSSGSHHAIRIVVARNGKTGQLTYCGWKVTIHIARDHFGVHLKTAGGAVSVFRIRGGWTSRRFVRGRIDLDFACDGRPGGWSATLR